MSRINQNPLYHAGDVLYNYSTNHHFIVKEVLMNDDGFWYSDQDGTWYQEELLWEFVDWLEYNMANEGTTYNAHFPIGYNPSIKEIDRENGWITFDWSVPIDVFAKHVSNEQSSTKVLIEGMRMPKCCVNCPLASYTPNDQIICGGTGTVEGNLQAYLVTKMADCPLRAVHKKSIMYENLPENE